VNRSFQKTYLFIRSLQLFYFLVLISDAKILVYTNRPKIPLFHLPWRHNSLYPLTACYSVLRLVLALTFILNGRASKMPNSMILSFQTMSHLVMSFNKIKYLITPQQSLLIYSEDFSGALGHIAQNGRGIQIGRQPDIFGYLQCNKIECSKTQKSPNQFS